MEKPYIGKLHTPEGEIEVTLYKSERDGAWVCEIDTPGLERGPKLRAYVNDGAVYENPPFPVD